MVPKPTLLSYRRTWEICEVLKNLSRSRLSPRGFMRNCEKNDKELGTRKEVNESKECELVTADSLGTERARRKEESLQALQFLLQKKYRCKVSLCLWFEEKSSLTRYSSKKVQKEYTTGSVWNGVTVPKQPGKLTKLLHYLLRKKLCHSCR